MNDVIVKRIVRSPPAVIWNIWTDFPQAPLWDTDVRHCELDGPFQAGTLGKCVLKNGLRMPLKLDVVEFQESYRNSARLLWMHLEFDHRMRRLSPSETQVIHTARIAGPLSSLYRRLVRKALTAAMSTALDNLASLAERRANTSGTPASGKPESHLHLV